MRRLHVVAPHEIFVASGEYRYWRDGVPNKAFEKFTIHELPGGAFLYRVDEDGRDEDGLTILSEALINPEQRFERFNVQSYNPRDPLLLNFKADYTFNPDYVQIGSQVQGADREYDEFALIDGCEIYIKQTLYMGLTLRHVLARDGTAHVFTPQLLALDSSQLQKLIVKSQDIESLNIGRKTIDAHKYQVADEVFYWIDEHGIPIQRQYIHDGATYQVQVTNYAHR
ncbi:MAG: hypothetical protein ACFE0Q_14630 [Anaerolineae bacterium]